MGHRPIPRRSRGGGGNGGGARSSETVGGSMLHSCSEKTQFSCSGLQYSIAWPPGGIAWPPGGIAWPPGGNAWPPVRAIISCMLRGCQGWSCVRQHGGAPTSPSTVLASTSSMVPACRKAAISDTCMVPWAPDIHHPSLKSLSQSQRLHIHQNPLETKFSSRGLFSSGRSAGKRRETAFGRQSAAE